MTTSMKPDPTEPYQEPDTLEGGPSHQPSVASDPLTSGQIDADLDDLARHVADQISPPVENADPQSASHEGEHDLAVEQYLAELLGRYGDTPGGMEGAAASVQAQPSTEPATPESTEPASADAGQVTGFEQEEEEPAPKRPTVAPEAMSAMREIANAHARSAIATHAYKTTTRSAFIKLFLAAGALVVSYTLLRMSEQVTSATYWLAVAALAIGGFWVCRYMGLSGTMGRIAEAKPTETAASESAELAVDDMPSGPLPA